MIAPSPDIKTLVLMHFYCSEFFTLKFSHIERKLNIVIFPREIPVSEAFKLLVVEDPINRSDGGLHKGKPIDAAASKKSI